MRKTTREQVLAIRALKRAVKMVNDSGLSIVMHDGLVTIHFADHYEKYAFDCGAYGMNDEKGEQIQPIASFSGINH
jgi:hypothetical protein